MPNLQQMYAAVNAKTAYSRPDEIYGALQEGGILVYNAVLKEMAGFFLKFDTTSVVLTPGQTEYLLPADLTNLVNIAERLTTTENWRQLHPTSVQNALDTLQDQIGWDAWDYLYTNESQFSFYGPYLKATAVGGTQQQAITISPAVDQIRMCEIAYTAKWLPIVNAQSTVMLPDEGTYAMQNYAIAEIHRGNDDTLSREYESKGDKHLASFLTWVRARQTVQRPQIKSYLDT